EEQDRDQDGDEDSDQAHGQGGGVFGGAHHRGAGADGGGVAQGAGGAGGGGGDRGAGGGADQGLDGVVDVVDHGDLVEDQLGQEQDRDDGQGPAALDPPVGLGEGDDVGEAGQEADQQQGDVGVQACRGRQAEAG